MTATCTPHNEITEQELEGMLTGVPVASCTLYYPDSEPEPHPLVAITRTSPIASGRGLRGDESWGPWSAASYEVVHLDDAMTTEWDDDAHAMPVVVVTEDGRVLGKQPRLTMDGIRAIRRGGCDVRVTSLWADLDNPGHASWTPALESIRVPAVERVETALWYMSRAGLRVVQPLTRWLAPEEFRDVHPEWLRQIADVTGLVPDEACKDWTRHYRLPRVVRDSRRQLARGRWTWTAIEPPPVPIRRPAVVPQRSELSRIVGSTSMRSEAGVARYIERIPAPVCGSGTCDKTAYRVAAKLVSFGLDESSALDLLGRWADRASHAWTPEDLQRKLDHARRAGGGR